MSKGRRGRATDHQLVPMRGQPVRSFTGGRICAHEGCATVLSIYNGNVFCSLHQRLGEWWVAHPL